MVMGDYGESAAPWVRPTETCGLLIVSTDNVAVIVFFATEILFFMWKYQKISACGGL